MSFTATRTGTGDAARIWRGTSTSHRRELVPERAIPAASFPRAAPALTTGARRAPLDLHLGLVNRPRRHRPRARRVLGDHRLQYRERQSRRGVILELPGVERELA